MPHEAVGAPETIDWSGGPVAAWVPHVVACGCADCRDGLYAGKDGAPYPQMRCALGLQQQNAQGRVILKDDAETIREANKRIKREKRMKTLLAGGFVTTRTRKVA